MTTGSALLLDTHTFLWMTSQSQRLGPAASAVIADAASDLVLSVASIWEMASKSSLGKLELPSSVEAFLSQQLAATRTRVLEIRAPHATQVAGLPWHHRDPLIGFSSRRQPSRGCR